MKYLVTLIIICFGISLSAQYRADFETNSTGAERRILRINNVNDGTFSAAAFDLQSGTAANSNLSSVTSWAKSYTGLPGYGGYIGISNEETGILFRSFGTNSNIRMLTGGDNLASNTRMYIESDGNIGIATEVPKSKLEVASGDVYMSTIGTGVILKSPNGSCFRVEVSNAGALSATSIACPN